MEAQSLLSGFCLNPPIPRFQNTQRPFLVKSLSSSQPLVQSPSLFHSFTSKIENPPLSLKTHLSFTSKIENPPLSLKTHHSFASKIAGFKKKFHCANSVEKVEGITNGVEDLKIGVRKKNLAVFVSGGGSNFRSIHEAALRGSIYGDIVVLVTNKHGCGGAVYARNSGIPVISFPKTKDEPEGLSTNDLVATLRRYNVDFIILAGYLKLIPVELIRAYPRRILNIHPSLLPAFGGKGYYGMKVHKAVIASGARYSGPTIHMVDEQYDTGRIIAQRVVPVLANDTADELAARVLSQEHILYVEVAAALCEERIIWREDGVPLIQSKENPTEYS